MAQGFVVVALTAAFGGFVSQSTAATEQDRTAMREARAAVADAALDAVHSARAATDAAEDVTVDDATVDELDAATAELEELLDEAGVLSARTTGAASRSGDRTASGTARDGTTSDRTATDGTATDGTATDGTAADEGATDGAAADGAAAGGAATDGAATDGAATDGAATDGAATDGAAADGAATDAPEPDGTATPDAAAPEATPTTEARVQGLLSASEDRLPTGADTTTGAPGDTSSEAPSSDAAGPEAGTDATADPAAAGDAAADPADDVVVPPVEGPEDETTRQIREALERVVELSHEVAETTQEERERIAAEQKAAAEKAAAEKAAAEAAAKAEAEAAAKAAAEAAAAKEAERAAWKASLRGYANGQIPASALCAPSFDSGALLRCDAAEDLDALDAAYYADFGAHLAISDSYRSYGSQVSCRARKGWLCARPGTSNHGTGVAVDLGGGIQVFGTAQHVWMQKHAADFGWVHPSWARAGGSKPEAWHWEYTR
ncbi:M15 family metallopeptidase [Cellulomonas persica]|uniref:M15 family metallopeptidase n=1 Tax=Cellulomonas persica TaxID=76861 RepID=UPI0011BEB1B0|nr:M15 family metallopeptidase [Cellulomonas persica]